MFLHLSEVSVLWLSGVCRKWKLYEIECTSWHICFLSGQCLACPKLSTEVTAQYFAAFSLIFKFLSLIPLYFFDPLFHLCFFNMWIMKSFIYMTCDDFMAWRGHKAIPLYLVLSLESSWQQYAFSAARDNPCCYQSMSILCLHVRHSTMEVWACISGIFIRAMMTVKVWHKHMLHQVYLNFTIMHSSVAAREFSSLFLGSYSWFRTSNGD